MKIVITPSKSHKTLFYGANPQKATLHQRQATSCIRLRHHVDTSSNSTKSLPSLFGLMGLRMEDLHAPTVASGPTSHAQTNGTAKEPTFQELVAQKENVEAELSALGSVLESVHTSIYMLKPCSLTDMVLIARRQHEHFPNNLRWLPSRRHRRSTDTNDTSAHNTAQERS